MLLSQITEHRQETRSKFTSGPVMCIIPDMAEAMES